ncbi:HAD family hydrolase [candidate division KSB1 bacterium]|nr:HAD family hydrolase [candidate division KSB1 bacterium]
MRYKKVIWDWNGTLIDDTWLCVEIINELLVKYEKSPITLEIYQKAFDFPVRDYYQRIGFDFNETPFEIIGSEFMDRYWQRWQECALHDGARELVEELKAQNISQLIVSAAQVRLLHACVNHFQIAPFFDELRGLDDHYATGKEGLVQDYVRSIAIAPSEIIFIGDTLHDCDVARSADAACILVARGHHPRYRLEYCGAPVFDSLRCARDYIFQGEAIVS